ncbi:hypothetical protein MTR67_006828 [Solanum verrucosum]|uniref:Uncharacterized protein n=1 Tax=Solanum verrucosum TaxID=315347 RepID=A0AAF0PZ19_SOLVR|nr:hypothetical protein MTR67_006828 [Solanum verrucosum]
MAKTGDDVSHSRSSGQGHPQFRNKCFDQVSSNALVPKFNKDHVSNSKHQGGNGGNGSSILSCTRCGRCLELLKDYDMSVLYHPEKANVVADSLSWLSMGSVAPVEDNKELVHDVHRLARLVVRFVKSNEGGVVVHNGSKSSFVSNVKSKKDVDMILFDLNELVSKKSIEVFFQW